MGIEINEHYIYIVETSSATKPYSLGDSAIPFLDEAVIETIIDVYQNYLSVSAIKSSFTNNSKLNLLHATTQDK